MMNRLSQTDNATDELAGQPSEEQRELAAAEYLAVAETWVADWHRGSAAFPTHVLLDMFPHLTRVVIRDQTITGPHGPVPARLYESTRPQRGTLMWIHGGGFATGDLAMPEAHWVSLSLASEGYRVLSVDYRKTLEGARFPVAADDVRAAWRWLVEQTMQSGFGSQGLHLGGASAGAALAASLVVRLRDVGEPLPDSLVLVYPVVHPRLPSLTTELQAATEGVPPTARVIEGMSAFVAGSVATLSDPHAFAGVSVPTSFPSTLILNSERDHLRASGELFAEQLRDAGVPVDCVTEPGARHGHLNEPDNPAGIRSLSRIVDWLARGDER